VVSLVGKVEGGRFEDLEPVAEGGVSVLYAELSWALVCSSIPGEREEEAAVLLLLLLSLLPLLSLLLLLFFSGVASALALLERPLPRRLTGRLKVQGCSKSAQF